MSETNHSSRDQRHDDAAVFNVVSGPERVVPVIKQFRDMAPDTKREHYNGAEIENPPSHVGWMPFWRASLKTI